MRTLPDKLVGSTACVIHCYRLRFRPHPYPDLELLNNNFQNKTFCQKNVTYFRAEKNQTIHYETKQEL